MELVPGGVVPQTKMALKNLEAILTASDSDITKVIKNTIFLKDLNDFKAVNDVYQTSMFALASELFLKKNFFFINILMFC